MVGSIATTDFSSVAGLGAWCCCAGRLLRACLAALCAGLARAPHALQPRCCCPDPQTTWCASCGRWSCCPCSTPALFEGMGLRPPRGILFHGVPGTGKTLVARALAGACAKHSPLPVTFFARKGADCLGKFHGEAERTLRLLFQEVRCAALCCAVLRCVLGVACMHCRRPGRPAARRRRARPLALPCAPCRPATAPPPSSSLTNWTRWCLSARRAPAAATKSTPRVRPRGTHHLCWRARGSGSPLAALHSSPLQGWSRATSQVARIVAHPAHPVLPRPCCPWPRRSGVHAAVSHGWRGGSRHSDCHRRHQQARGNRPRAAPPGPL